MTAIALEIEHPCVYCGKPNLAERVALGKRHCMADRCVIAWRQGEQQKFAFVLVPKQGFTVVRRDDATALDARAARGK